MKKTLLLISLLLSFSIAFGAIQQPLEKPTAEECENLSSIGFASDINTAVLDADKIAAVLNSFESDYYCLKNILGLWDYNFYIILTNPAGTEYATIYGWDTNLTGVYGVFPGNNVLVSNIPGSYAEQLEVSQSIELPTGGISAYFIWEEQGPTVLAAPTPAIVQQNILPNPMVLQNLKTFKRVVVIDNGEGIYETALLTLGVWY